MLLHEVISFAAEATPDALALVDGDRRWTFAELDRWVRSAALAYAELAEPGERIAVVAGNSAEFVIAMYSVPLAGCILVPLNTRHTAGEQAAIVRSCGASVVLGDDEGLTRLRACEAELPDVRHWGSLTTPGDAPAAPDVGQRSDLDDGDTVWLIHTSGTTGKPKGSMITHRSLIAACLNTAIGRGVADDEVYLFPFPLFHVAAYNVVVHHLRRRPVVLLARFDAAEVLRTVERESVTSMSLAPTMLAMLLDHPDRGSADLSSLRRVSYGASAMPPDLLRRTAEELPDVGMAQGYGMTELSGNAVFLGPDEHRRALAGEAHLLAAAGRPGPLAAVRIAGPHGDDPLPVGEVGEIVVRGDQVHAGYWDDPDATAAARSGPWLRTGDLGRIDADGYLYVVDRLKDVIITGGENVASREVEDVLCTHPDVAAVAVIGEPDEQWGERVCAVVVWRDGGPGTDDERAAALIEWSRGRLAGFKRPRAVRTVDALPVNPSGKVDKKVLRDSL